MSALIPSLDLHEPMVRVTQGAACVSGALDGSTRESPQTEIAGESCEQLPEQIGCRPDLQVLP
jgi:hypothetical protein